MSDRMVGQVCPYALDISKTDSWAALVRVSAKELTSLILDEQRLRGERQDRKTWKSRVTGIEEFGPQGSGYPGSSEHSAPRRRPERRKQGTDEEDAEYRLAIEASKYEAEEDKKRRQTNSAAPVDDDDLAKAIRLSKEEEELRRRELEETNSASLFDDTPAPSTQPQLTGYNQGYQQQGAVDWFGNPVEQQAQQPQSTGYLNNAYSQQTGFQNQPTGYQNGFSNGFSTQPTGFDQSQQQQQQPGFLQQQNTLQPQTTAFNSMSNPYAQPSNDFSSQFQSQQTSTPQAGTHNPWATTQQSQLEALKPAATGSNNPFASSLNRPQYQNMPTNPSSLSTLPEQKTATQFNPITSFTPPAVHPQSTLQPPKDQNPQHARLNALLASGEGMDTFGNTGDLRIPSQHTAPGTFVNSAGGGLDRLHAAQTGTNPFFSQQFTGGPPQQQTSAAFGNTTAFAQQPASGRLMPAQTGPAGMGMGMGANGFGGGPSPFAQSSHNPFGAGGAQGGFGAGQTQQQASQQTHQQGGSLIDL